MNNVYLLGLMGAGKSTVGPLLAGELHRAFEDSDQWIERRLSTSIAAFFQREGERAFRRVERQVIREITQTHRRVIALGGGAPLDEENWRAIQSTGITVYLRVGAATLSSRLQEDRSRPLLALTDQTQKQQKIEQLLALREPSYRRAHLLIECLNLSPQTLARQIAKELSHANS